MPIAVFQQCGTTVRPRSRASTAIRRASVRPPTRPTSGWTTSSASRSISSRNSKRLFNSSPAATRIGDAAVSLV